MNKELEERMKETTRAAAVKIFEREVRKIFIEMNKKYGSLMRDCEEMGFTAEEIIKILSNKNK